MRFAQLSMLLAGTLLACSEAPDEPADELDQLAAALEDDHGGLDTADEAPMFAATDAFAAAAIEPDAAATDALAADPAVIELRERTDVRRVRVAVLWGELPPDRTADLAHDWTGRLRVNRGAILVRRTIGFEAATDEVLPRVDRTFVDFRSVTRPFVDGLVLEVIDDAPASTEPQVLAYGSRDGAVRVPFPLPRLATGPISVDVDGENRIVAALVPDRDGCDRGFLRGRWHALREGLGVMLGVVSDADGATVGHLRGLWGERRDGSQVFFGKYIDLDGRFRGLYAGHYADGGFAGRWIVSTGDYGRLQGRYRESLPGPEVGGAFIGRWAETSCADGM